MGNAGRFASGSAQTPRPKVSFFVLSVAHLVKFRVCLSGGAHGVPEKSTSEASVFFGAEATPLVQDKHTRNSHAFYFPQSQPKLRLRKNFT